jgi:hypothetical protein
MHQQAVRAELRVRGYVEPPRVGAQGTATSQMFGTAQLQAWAGQRNCCNARLPNAKTRTPRSHRLCCAAFLNRKKPDKKTQNLSNFEAFFRKAPFFKQYADGTMLLGDCVMILATQYSSGQISYNDSSFLGLVVLLSWVCFGGSRGDYNGKGDDYDNEAALFNMGIPLFAAMVNSCVTWAGTCTVSVAVFAFLISHNLMEPGAVWVIPAGADIPPETEVLVAMLITMSCWRALLLRFRMSPFL